MTGWGVAGCPPVRLDPLTQHSQAHQAVVADAVDLQALDDPGEGGGGQHGGPDAGPREGGMEGGGGCGVSVGGVLLVWGVWC